MVRLYLLVPLGQRGVELFLIVAAIGIILLSRISTWYKKQLILNASNTKKKSLNPLF